MHPAADNPDENSSVVRGQCPLKQEAARSGDTLAESDIVLTSEHQVRPVTGWKWILVCIGLYCAIFLYGLDNTVAADIQSAIVDTYGDVGQLAWIGTGFPLGSVATILTL